MQPAPVEVELAPPPGVSATANVRVTVAGPGGLPYWMFSLTPREGNLYTADRMMQFPLEPPGGEWRLKAHVQSELDVVGEQELVFRPVPIRFHDLTDVLPAGVNIRVPQDFIEKVAQGDQWAGGRVWWYGDSGVSLWWGPGPLEPLLLHNAVVMLEATYDPDAPPHVLGVEETEWQEQTAFLFHEDWPGASGSPSEALVAQGPDYWLYVLRVRAAGGEAISPLLRLVQKTFTFVEE
jgi:hypothetical protein